MIGKCREQGALRGQSGYTLVELLVVMIIMGIVSTMILGTWFALSRSYANASESSKQRDNAEAAMERLTRELRDVQGTTATNGAAILSGGLGPNEVRFNSSFNMIGASTPTSPPQLVRYYLSSNGTLYRQLAGSDRVFGTEDDSTPSPLVRDVVNGSHGADLFEYYWYDGDGTLVHSVESTNLPSDTSRVKAIKITLFVDLNPGHSPDAMQLVTVVQPRNLRTF